MGEFDKIARSIELHIRFDFRLRENSVELNSYVAQLITANLKLLVMCLYVTFENESVFPHSCACSLGTVTISHDTTVCPIVSPATDQAVAC